MIQVHLATKRLAGQQADLLICFYEAATAPDEPPRLPPCVRELAQAPWRVGDLAGKEGDKVLLYPDGDDFAEAGGPVVPRLLLVGLGEDKQDEAGRCERLRLAAGTAAREAGRLKVRRLLAIAPTVVGLSAVAVTATLVEGLLLGNYRFDKYKNKKTDEDEARAVEDFVLHQGELPRAEVREGLRLGRIAAAAVACARDMAHEPANHWTPEHFARFARRLEQRHKLFCQVLDRGEMKKLGMGGILGVSQGTAAPPRLVVLGTPPHAGRSTLLLVGKGLTFDSGGVCLKPAAGMEEMKYDMCGGAAVLAVMQALAELEPKHLNVVAVVPASENMAGSGALKPGDVIRHYNGKTSEVVNTDAEGRLLLADALAFGIERFKPEAVIDLATLTGAVIVGLGHHRSGLLSTDDELAARLLAAGDRCGEPLWRLPLGPEYTKQLKSEVADLKNTGGKGGGTITGAAYLQEFVGEIPWAHLDIAGTAWDFTEKSYVPKGPSGVGVRTLIELIRCWAPLTNNSATAG
ncbi:MAG: leucyl aminopeptidase [Desulfobulbaceae bacterium A2]|nr:MAG: leucyl aminopeptidase [Desulfobulbaceae bacterium A2]